jgi:hypothetical protein
MMGGIRERYGRDQGRDKFSRIPLNKGVSGDLWERWSHF